MANVKYGYCETSDILSGRIYSVKKKTAGALENGQLVKVGANVKGEIEIVDAELAKIGEAAALLCTPLVNKQVSTLGAQIENTMRLEDGEIGRAYSIPVGSRFAIADYMITPLSGSVVVGNKVAWDGSKYVEVAASGETKTYAFVADITYTQPKRNVTLVGLTVAKNADVAQGTGEV